MQMMQICDKGWNIVNDNSKASFDAGNKITYNTGVLKQSLLSQRCLYFSKRWYYCHSNWYDTNSI